MTPQGASHGKEQINLTVDAATARALRLIAVRDGTSVQELLRPRVERLVRDRLKRDSDLTESLRALESSIGAEDNRRRRRRGVAKVSELKRGSRRTPARPRQPTAERNGR
jgi:hypothetical protein